MWVYSTHLFAFFGGHLCNLPNSSEAVAAAGLCVACGTAVSYYMPGPALQSHLGDALMYFYVLRPGGMIPLKNYACWQC